MIESERIVAASATSPNEEAIERALRPASLAEYVGQPKVREQLDIFITAARNRAESLDHVLLFGPPGLGKTTPALYCQPEAIVLFFRNVSTGIELPLIVQDFEVNGPGLTLSLIAELRNKISPLAGTQSGNRARRAKVHRGAGSLRPGLFHRGRLGGPAIHRSAGSVCGRDGTRGFHGAGLQRHTSQLRSGPAADGQGDFHALLPILAFTNQELTTSIAFFKRLLVRKGIFATGQMQMPGFVWDEYNSRIADELIDHYLTLEKRVLREVA